MNLCSITFIKKTFPKLVLFGQKYYCAKSKTINQTFNSLLLGNNVDFKLDIQSNTNNLYKLDDTHPIDINKLKNAYIKELDNIKSQFNFNDTQVLSLTSTMDKYFFKFEQKLCYCVVKNSIYDCIGST